MEDINAVPNFKILIVNTNSLFLDRYKKIADTLFNLHDNVSVYTAQDYGDAIKMIDELPIDILITSYRFYGEMDGNGFDLCKHMKQKNSYSVCSVISLILIERVTDIYRKAYKEMDFAYDSTVLENHYQMFCDALEALREKLAEKAGKEQKTK